MTNSVSGLDSSFKTLSLNIEEAFFIKDRSMKIMRNKTKTDRISSFPTFKTFKNVLLQYY